MRRWLSKDHPDPDAKNLRNIWLPALEWYYSERVRQLYRCMDANGNALSDAEWLEAADFGLFIDLASMCQKEGDQNKRTAVEEALFRHALNSLDIICARAPVYWR